MLTWPPKDPSENPIDYDINWVPRLSNADGTVDTVASSTWSIAAGVSLTINSNIFTTTRTKVWLSGGILGQTYLLKNTVTTAGGRVEIETASLLIKAK